MSTDLMVSTYSMWSQFRNCRKAVDWRYLQHLVPLERDRNLHFGSLIHECLQVWHERGELPAVLALIDRLCPNRIHDENQRRDAHLATAMMKAYASRYAAEEFEVLALEKTFEGPIVNPATGAASRSFVLAGKVDGIIRIGSENFVLEHKTASQLDSDYLERLWTDFQITIYAYYVEQTMGIPITGILYNVLVKGKLQQSKGETEEEFETRRAELLAKSKTGKSSAKRRMPETDDEFQQRLAEKYTDQTMLHREMLYLARDRFEILRSELWELTQAFLDARRRGVFYQNTGFCFNYQRPCPYFALCRSNGNPNVIENFYQRVEPHEELRVIPPQPSETAQPIF
ncbi:MAG TPA: PD-(D/E)XK nuclease family protein [Bryobacteraceae bacterium]|nr:PD-(D/E)XK nuclease family protein [Bryobacteraceae bacterium]HPT25781.1 PD-(D/E)XK nuclease family protein [Bryobacteraceae bacterium]